MLCILTNDYVRSKLLSKIEDLTDTQSHSVFNRLESEHPQYYGLLLFPL